MVITPIVENQISRTAPSPGSGRRRDNDPVVRMLRLNGAAVQKDLQRLFVALAGDLKIPGPAAKLLVAADRARKSVETDAGKEYGFAPGNLVRRRFHHPRS